jgi:hypothetical protein
MKTEVKSEFEAQIAYSGNDHTPKRTNNLQAIVK